MNRYETDDVFGEEITNQSTPRALVGPGADFWLVGGASILMLACFAVLSNSWFKFDSLQSKSSWWAFNLAFAVNYPHFAYSYMLFYPGFFKRLLGKETAIINKIRLGVAGLLVPLLMLGYFVYAWRVQDHAKYLGWSALAMIFLVGWHYVKQGYGVLITMSVYKDVFYNGWEKRTLYLNAYMVWVYTWARTNSAEVTQNYYDVTYTTFVYPEWLVQGCLILACVTTALTITVLLRHWIADEEGISFNAVVGYAAAIYFWTLWPYLNTSFFVFLAFFHSLQYLPFVYKFKKSEFIQSRIVSKEGILKTDWLKAFGIIIFVILGIVLGASFFEWIPAYMDKNVLAPGMDRNFFLISFIVFINIHHFFIDSAFWRRDNTQVQKCLFRA